MIFLPKYAFLAFLGKYGWAGSSDDKASSYLMTVSPGPGILGSYLTRLKFEQIIIGDRIWNETEILECIS